MICLQQDGHSRRRGGSGSSCTIARRKMCRSGSWQHCSYLGCRKRAAACIRQSAWSPGRSRSVVLRGPWRNAQCSRGAGLGCGQRRRPSAARQAVARDALAGLGCCCVGTSCPRSRAKMVRLHKSSLFSFPLHQFSYDLFLNSPWEVFTLSSARNGSVGNLTSNCPGCVYQPNRPATFSLRARLYDTRARGVGTEALMNVYIMAVRTSPPRRSNRNHRRSRPWPCP